jgi:hypothetical protein
MKNYVYLYSITLSSLYSEECFRQKLVEKVKTYIFYSIFFFPKIMAFMRYCGKIWYTRSRHS